LFGVRHWSDRARIFQTCGNAIPLAVGYALASAQLIMGFQNPFAFTPLSFNILEREYFSRGGLQKEMFGRNEIVI
jgi:hypothetical protein